MQHDCDLDVNDKHHAQGIDDLAHQLRNRSCKIGFHPGIEKHDNTYATRPISRSLTYLYSLIAIGRVVSLVVFRVLFPCLSGCPVSCGKTAERITGIGNFAVDMRLIIGLTNL